MDLTFIRHGEPAWSVDGVSQPDPHLTDRGSEQARLTAERLAASPYRPSKIIASPRHRAVETAAPAASLLGLEPYYEDDLEEIRMPDWTGELEERVQEIFAEARGRPPDDWWNGLPGGESFYDFHDRVSQILLKMLGERGVRAHPGGNPQLWESDGTDNRLVIVAHGGTNSVALSYLLGIDPTPWEWERFTLGHASIARLRLVELAGGHVFSLRAFNDREHLPADLRTR